MDELRKEKNDKREKSLLGRKEMSRQVQDFIDRKGSYAKMAINVLGYSERQTLYNRLKFHSWKRDEYTILIKEKVIDEIAIDW